MDSRYPAYGYPNVPGPTPISQYEWMREPAQPKLGWFERNQKNKPQSNSVGPAALIFLSGGMSMAWGVGFPSYTATMTPTVYMNICWFVAAIVGVLLAAIFTNILRKKIFMFTSSVLVVLGGILFVSLPSNNAAIMIARHMNGFAVGFVFVPAMVMVGEEGVKEMRGMIVSTVETMCFSLGIACQVTFVTTWSVADDVFPVNQMHGGICILYGLLSFIFVFFLVIESPVFLLVRGQETEAIDSLRRLQSPFKVTYETYKLLAEHKKYIDESKQKSMTESFVESVPALLKLCIHRAIIALSISLIVNIAFIRSITLLGPTYDIWPYMIYGYLRFIGSCVGAFMIDSIGRKKPLIRSLIVCGIVAIVVAVLFNDAMSSTSTKMCAAMILLFAIQILGGIVANSSSAYLSEAFPLAVKPFCIAMAYTTEQLVHIIIGSIAPSSDAISVYFYAFGGLSIIFVLFTIACLPETKKTTLREAQATFRGFFCSRLNRSKSNLRK